MKLLPSILIALSLTACQQSTIQNGTVPTAKTVVIDGCDYIVVEIGNPGLNSYSFSITHKGNCKNTIHDR